MAEKLRRDFIELLEKTIEQAPLYCSLVTLGYQRY